MRGEPGLTRAKRILGLSSIGTLILLAVGGVLIARGPGFYGWWPAVRIQLWRRDMNRRIWTALTGTGAQPIGPAPPP